MKCDKNYDLVSYLNNEVTTGERAEIEAHLLDCPDCRQEFAALKATIGRLKSIPPITPSPALKTRIMEQVSRFQPQPVHTLWFIPRFSYVPAWAVSVAVHLIIFAGLSIIFIRPVQKQQEKTISIRLAQRVEEEKKLLDSSPGLPLVAGEIKPEEREPAVQRPAGEDDIPTPLPDRIKRPIPEGIIVTRPVDGWKVKLKPVPDRDDKLLAHFNGRSNIKTRRELLQKYQAGDTEPAVKGGLNWLAQAQSPDGAWDGSRYGGRKEYQVALSSLSLLCFLADGHNHISGGAAAESRPERRDTYTALVNRGIKFLLAQQDSDGLVGPKTLNGKPARPNAEGGQAGSPALIGGDPVTYSGMRDKPVNYMYNHGLATLCLLEDYIMSRDPALERPVNQAVSFIISAQNANGGWGYTKGSPTAGDSSVTAWQIPSLKLAQTLGIGGAAESLEKAKNWLNSLTNADGFVGYSAPEQYPNGPYGLSAAGMSGQLFMDQSSSALSELQAHLLTKRLPHLQDEHPETESDFYYTYWGTLSMFLQGGKDWETWNKNTKQTLLKSQVRNGSYAGSWVPDDKWGYFGGRIYATSMAILSLQVYYRYPALTDGR
ncbi:MAG: zf-HC2 domain-containing protein [Planctomycetes bacterium]|nr:zf-HC2 domain-containing protein [Planctomycetota bacterium]